MIIDEFGLVRDSGSTDFCDSPRLAGVMALVDHPKTPDLTQYIVTPIFDRVTEKKNLFWRHPFTALSTEKETDPKNFSRDQLIPLTAGLLKQGYKIQMPGWRAQNGDLLINPSVRGHLKICAGGKANWFHKLCLKSDIKYNAWRLERWADGKEKFPVEQTQLIAMCFTYGPEWVRKYRTSFDSKLWEGALRDYWIPWRGEPELCEMIVKKVESYL